MKNKHGFTMPELIAIIVLISIILILVIPNIVDMSDKSKISLHDSKIRSLETAAEKYGNALINDYQDCIKDSDEEYLNNKCVINIRDLVVKEYITPDENYDIIDPRTNAPFNGNLLLCYDPSKVNVYAKYLERDEIPQCRDINVTTGASLTLSPGSGTGYNGGNPIYVKILKTGKFESFECKSDNESLVSCKIEGTNLKLNINRQENFTSEFETVKVELIGKLNTEEKLSQSYTLKVYPTSITVDESTTTTTCLESGSTEELNIHGTNMGAIKIENDSEAIETTLKNNTSIILKALDKTGDTKVLVKEENGNASYEIARTIFKLQLDKNVPNGLLLGNKETFNITYGGNESVTITSNNPGVLKLYKDNETDLVDSLTLSNGDKTFHIKAISKGEANIKITGSKCGQKDYTIAVSNLYIDSPKVQLYVGGKSESANIVSGSNDTFTCASSDESIVKCEIENSNLKIIPGIKEGLGKITVYGASGGYDELEVETKNTSIKLLNDNSKEIVRICSDKETGPTESITISGTNMGTVSVEEISDPNLLSATITGNKLVPFNKNITSLDNLDSKYVLGTNTGISKVKVKESNGNKTASFDYNIFDLKTASGESRYEVTKGDTIQVKIKSSATGPIRAISNDENVASITVNNPGYSFDVNAQNESTITIEGKKTGSTTITVTGAYCGSLTFSVEVVGQEYFLNLELGTYSKGFTNIEAGKVTCNTEGTSDSCEITFPEIITSPEFVVKGFSKTKDAKVAEYTSGDKITVSSSNSGTTYYANSVDEVKPRCVFTDDMSSVKLNKTEYYKIVCEEAGSGAAKHITKDSFTISDPSVAEVTDVQGPEEILDSESRVLGYSYKVGIKGKSMIGNFDFTLKADQLVDKFGNGNDEIKESSIIAAEYKAITKWYIGKNDPTDIIAVLYFNKNLPPEITENDSKDMYTLILYGSGETKDYSSLEYYNIPWVNNGYQSFITNVIVEEGITSLGDRLLQNLPKMNRITLPSTIEKFGEESMRQNVSLKSITIPPLIENIPKNTFEGCKNLEYLELNEGLKTIGETAFLNHGLKSLHIPASVTKIGARAFEASSENMQLEILEFAKGIQLENIESDTFSNHRLKKLQIPASVKFIGIGAFSQYSIDDNTLRELTFEENSSVSHIFDEAFLFCEFSHLELPSTLVSIGSNTFNVRPEISTFTVGPNIETLGSSFIYGDNLREILVDPNNAYFASDNGVLYNKAMTTLIKYPDAYYATHDNYSIKEGTKKIEEMAFGGTIRRSNDITFTLNLPSSLDDINYDTNFIGSFISEFVVNSSNQNYASIDGILYSKDLKTAYKLPLFYKKEKYTLPETTEVIAMYFAFANMSLKELTIPSSVKGISSLAFYTDPDLALSIINLDSSEDLGLGESALDIVRLTPTKTLSRTINVNSETLKTRLESLYSNDDIKLELKRGT